MDYTRPRRKLNESIITFPATKTAGALTIASEEFADFESYAYGDAVFGIGALDKSKITDTLTIKGYVSYDEGTTWIQTGSYSELANGAGVAGAAKVIKYAPRVKTTAVFDAAGALAEDHGCSVHCEMYEKEPNLRRKYYADVDTLAATLTAGTASVYYGTKTAIEENTEKLVAIVSATDLSKVTDTFTYMLQCSYDGTYWWDMWASAKTDFDNGTGVLFAQYENDSTAPIGNYARVNFTYDATGALAASHGGSVSLLALY